MNQKANWNVIVEEKFKPRVQDLFSQVSESLSRSLGPYGQTTIIEQMGEYHFTKDGWSILKRFVYDQMFEQNMMSLVKNIASQVVNRVGDGSSSSIVAADAMYRNLVESDAFKRIPPRDAIRDINEVVDAICERINQNAQSVDADYTQIYDLAKVSLNGEEDIAKMIQDIYRKTNNPSIEYKESNDAATTYEIIDGYQTNIRILDPIYANRNDGAYEVKNPLVLMFESAINFDDHYPIISIALTKARSQGRTLVTIAAGYESDIIDYIKRWTNGHVRANNTIDFVFAKANIISKANKKEYADLATLLGAAVITRSYFFEIMEPTFKKLEEDKSLPQQHIEHETVEKVHASLGSVNDLRMTDRKTFFKGFDNRNDALYEASLRQAQADYDKLREREDRLNAPSIETYEAKNRLSKLTCLMGIIHVGGASSLARKAQYDLVEDAVKSCESAYRSGYNVGGNLVIPYYATELLKEEKAKDVPNSSTISILELIIQSFEGVYRTVLANYFYFGIGSLSVDELVEIDSKLEKIISESLEKFKVFDLTKANSEDPFDNNIINSSQTDVEILRATVSIVSLIVTSNQYVSIMPSEDPTA